MKAKITPVYQVPTDDGVIHQWALVKKGRQSSQFVDPANPDAGLIDWTGNWRQLQVNNAIDLHPENFPIAWDLLNFPLLFRNTLIIAITGMIGTLMSSICVAYAFARFPIPGKNILFIILIGTIILPTASDADPDLRLLRQDRLDGDVAAADRAALLRQRL